MFWSLARISNFSWEETGSNIDCDKKYINYSILLTSKFFHISWNDGFAFFYCFINNNYEKACLRLAPTQRSCSWWLQYDAKFTRIIFSIFLHRWVTRGKQTPVSFSFIRRTESSLHLSGVKHCAVEEVKNNNSIFPYLPWKIPHTLQRIPGLCTWVLWYDAISTWLIAFDFLTNFGEK